MDYEGNVQSIWSLSQKENDEGFRVHEPRLLTSRPRDVGYRRSVAGEFRFLVEIQIHPPERHERSRSRHRFPVDGS